MGGCGWQSLLEDAVKDVQAKYKADRALLKETYKALPQTIPGRTHPPGLSKPRRCPPGWAGSGRREGWLVRRDGGGGVGG